jgi:hypothetical protein
MVDFDIAVTADSRSDARGKLALKVAGIGGIEGGGGSVIRDTVVSRVKFQIPITLHCPTKLPKVYLHLQPETAVPRALNLQRTITDSN